MSVCCAALSGGHVGERRVVGRGGGVLRTRQWCSVPSSCCSSFYHNMTGVRTPGGNSLNSNRRVASRRSSITTINALPEQDIGQSTSNKNNDGEESTVVFLAKLIGAAFVLGAIVKYGSLVIDVPFEPSPGLALGIVMTPPSMFAIWMLSRSD